MTGYTLDSTADARPHQMKFTLPGHLFTHLGFLECPCGFESDIYSRLLYVHVNGF